MTWIEKFVSGKYEEKGKYSYWLAPIKEDGEYTGYNEE